MQNPVSKLNVTAKTLGPAISHPSGSKYAGKWAVETTDPSEL